MNEHIIQLQDAVDGLRSLGNHTIDLILTDPAYASLEAWRSMGTTTRLKVSKSSSNQWFATVANDYFGPFLTECIRVLKKDRYLMLLGDERTSHIYYATLRECGIADDRIGFAYWRKSGKPKGPPCHICGSQPYHPGTRGMGYPFGQVVEKIVYAKIGKPKPPEDKTQRNDLGQYWVEEPILKGKQYYPTQKPVELLRKLIRITGLPRGSFVLDPFAGSGSTGYAAYLEGHQFLGFDTDPKALEFFQGWKRSWKEPLLDLLKKE